MDFKKYVYRKGKAFILSYNTYKNPQGDVVPVGNIEQPRKFKTCLENNARFEVENVKYDLTVQETRSFIYEGKPHCIIKHLLRCI